MSKRGQFTLFIVLGIVILLLVGLFFLFQNNFFNFASLTQSVSYPTDVQEVVDHVQECIDTSALYTTTHIGYSGGYATLPDRSFVSSSLGVTVPYYYDDGRDLTPSASDLEKQFNSFVSILITSCVDFTQFSGMNISEGNLLVDSSISSDTIDLTVSYPLEIQIGAHSYTLSTPYKTGLSAKLGALRTIAGEIVQYDIAHPQTINYDFLLGKGLTHITVAPVSSSTYIYVLQDNSSFQGQSNLTYIFAEYYSNLTRYGNCYDDADCSTNSTCVQGLCTEVHR